MFDARRVGRTTYVANQSLRGLLGRAYHSMNPPVVLWVLLAGLAAVLGLYLAVRAHQRGDIVLGMGICGLTGLLVSPISWNNHWVWMIPLLIALVSKVTDAVRIGWLALPAGLVALFYLGPLWWVEHDSNSLRYAPHGDLDVLYADAYILGGILILALIPFLTRTRNIRNSAPHHS